MEKSADAFRTISEVAEELSVPQHVLRFWETRFPQVRPLKRAGGRRYYRPADTVLLRVIRQLLYDEGYTIKGVQRLLREQGVKRLGDGSPTGDSPAVGSPLADPGQADLAPDDGFARHVEPPGSDPPFRIEPTFEVGRDNRSEETAMPFLDRAGDGPAPRPVPDAASAAGGLRGALALVEECLGIIRAVR